MLGWPMASWWSLSNPTVSFGPVSLLWVQIGAYWLGVPFYLCMASTPHSLP